MRNERWRTAFDVFGLAAYLTIMTGELPDRKLLAAARRGDAESRSDEPDPDPAPPEHAAVPVGT